MGILRKMSIPCQVSADLGDVMEGYAGKVATFRRRKMVSASNDSSSIVRFTTQIHWNMSKVFPSNPHSSTLSSIIKLMLTQTTNKAVSAL